MIMKKFFAAAAAFAVIASAAFVNTFAADENIADNTAYLNLNTGDWTEFSAEYTYAPITGNGTYTVSMKTSEAVDLGKFNALEIMNGDKNYGSEYAVTIDSVKINGAEKKLADGYTCSAGGEGITTRVNIYNEWDDPAKKKKQPERCQRLPMCGRRLYEQNFAHHLR